MPRAHTRHGRKRKDDDESHTLLGSICHDLREPLSSIVMGSSYLLKELAKSEITAENAEKSRHMAEAIKRAAERMNRLICDFHDLSLLDRGLLTLDLASHDVETLLDFVREALAPTLREHDAQLELGAPPEACVVRVDRARVVQLVEKLVRNACEASTRGAIVSLRAEPSIDGVVFRVSDTGRGIDETMRPHIFDYRWLATRRARKGAGLGLGIARGLVIAHGGDLRLESTGPRGTTFAFTLPAG